MLAKKGPLGKIWLAAHMEKKVPKVQIMSTNIPESVDNIENPDCPMALRVSGHLLLGVVRIFSRKVSYLMSDCSEAIVKIKDAFRGPGVVHLAPGASTRRYDEITNPENFDEMDLDGILPSQGLARDADDDLLTGMALPEGAFGDVTLGEPLFDAGGDMELDGGFGAKLAFGDDGAGAEEENEQATGFGVNDNIEAFAAPLGPPGSKRARRSPVGVEADAMDDEMEVERMRSATDGASPVGVSLDAPLGSNVPELPLGPEMEFDEAPRFDEEDMQMDMGLDAGGLGAAVVDEFDLARRASRETNRRRDSLGSPPAGTEDDAARKRRPKRKMVLDTALQIETAQMKAQLADTSGIILDLDDLSAEPLVGAAAAAHAAKRAVDPFLAPPLLAFVPAELVAQPCFLPPDVAPPAKRRRSIVASRAAEEEPAAGPAAGAAEGAAAAVDEEALTEPPPPRFDEAQEEDYPAFEEQQQFEPPMGEDEFGLEPPADAPRSAPRSQRGASAVEAPPCFAATTELPEVDANAVADPQSSSAAAGSQEARSYEDNWSLRTQKMYSMLAGAFEESEGMALSYDAMVAHTASKSKRRVVAGCFQELLFLTTHGVVQLTQVQAYGDIVISKADGFESVAIAGN